MRLWPALTVPLQLPLLAMPADAGPGDWITQRTGGDNYHFVEQWSDYLRDGDPATTFHTGPHAVNPTGHLWNFDAEVRNIWTNGTLAPGGSVSFAVTWLADNVVRSSQAVAFDGRGNLLQVSIDVRTPFHLRTVTRHGDVCVVGPWYPGVAWFDHSSPYAAFVVGSDVTEHELVDDGGWAVGHATTTVTVTNTGSRTARDVEIWSLIGRPTVNAPQQPPASCEGLTQTPAVGYEPAWWS